MAKATKAEDRAWDDAGFAPEEAADWRDAGFRLEEAAEWSIPWECG